MVLRVVRRTIGVIYSLLVSLSNGCTKYAYVFNEQSGELLDSGTILSRYRIGLTMILALVQDAKCSAELVDSKSVKTPVAMVQSAIYEWGNRQ